VGFAGREKRLLTVRGGTMSKQRSREPFSDSIGKEREREEELATNNNKGFEPESRTGKLNKLEEMPGCTMGHSDASTRFAPDSRVRDTSGTLQDRTHGAPGARGGGTGELRVC
jgi:hypothetical protein